MTKPKSSKKVTKLPGSIIVQTIKTIKVKKPLAKVAIPTIRVDYVYTPYQPQISPKPTTVEVDKIIAATYDVLNKASISFETVAEDNEFYDSLLRFLDISFKSPEQPKSE